MDLDEKKSRKKMYSKPNKPKGQTVQIKQASSLASKLGLRSTSSSSMMQEEPLEDMYHHNPEERILIFRRHGNYSYFGEEDIMRMRNRSCNAVCTKDCELYTLDKIVMFALPQELENIIKQEYPLIFDKICDRVLEKESRDAENKKNLLEVYSNFAELEMDRLMNTLTVAEIRDAEEVPPLESLYQHSIVKHPVETLLDTFNDKNYNIDEPSEKSDLELSEVMSDGVEELYSILKSSES